MILVSSVLTLLSLLGGSICSPIAATMPGNSLNSTILLGARQDDSISSWNYNAETRISRITGCTDPEKLRVRQAWKDAMMLAGAIGDVEKIMPYVWMTYEYFGTYGGYDGDPKAVWKTITGSLGPG